jgi:membrane protein
MRIDSGAKVRTRAAMSNGNAHTGNRVNVYPAPSLRELIMGLINDMSRLVRQEVQLARVEVQEKVAKSLRGGLLLVAGGLLGFTALVTLIAAMVFGYGEFLPVWLSALLVGLLIIILGAMVVRMGQMKLRELNPAPEQTIRSVQRDVQVLKASVGLDGLGQHDAMPGAGLSPRAAGQSQAARPVRRKQSVAGERSMWQVLKDTIREWQADEANQLAAALSYYTAVSIAPLLVLVVVIVGFFLGRAAAESELIAQLEGTMGEQGAAFLQAALENADQPTLASVAGILSFATLLWGSTNVFSQLQNSLNKIWDVEPKPGLGIMATIRSRFLSFTMVLGVAFMLLVSLVISAALAAVANWGRGILPGADWIWQVVNFAVSLGVVTLLFAAIFKVLPDAEISWRDVWLGAAVTALLFTIGKFALGLYLGNAGSAYGAVGSVVVFLLWVYYSAQILFFGAEFTQVYARTYGSGIEPAANAVRASDTPATEGAA